MERRRIGCESVGGAAKEVARKLVEQNEESKRAFRRILPVPQFAPRRRFMGGEKARTDLRVEGLVLGVPALLSSFTPEGNDVCR